MASPEESGLPVGNARPIVRDYTITCLAALVLIMLVLVEAGNGMWSVVPLILGAIGVLTSGGDCPGLNAVLRGVVAKLFAVTKLQLRLAVNPATRLCGLDNGRHVVRVSINRDTAFDHRQRKPLGDVIQRNRLPLPPARHEIVRRDVDRFSSAGVPTAVALVIVEVQPFSRLAAQPAILDENDAAAAAGRIGGGQVARTG